MWIAITIFAIVFAYTKLTDLYSNKGYYGKN